jgi:AAA+ superfamily predicted ATPase
MSANIKVLLRSRQTLIWISTREEMRVERSIIESAAKVGYNTVLWDCARGLHTNGNEDFADGRRAADPNKAIDACVANAERRVWIFRDLNKWLTAPSTIRRLKNAARDLQSAPGGSERAIIIISPSAEVPEDLQGIATVIDWALPNREEVAEILTATINATSQGLRAQMENGSEVAATRLKTLELALLNGAKEAAVDAAVGLTAEEIAGCYARSIVSTGAIDPDLIRKDKASVITQSQVLTWYEPDPRGLDAIGGLEGLKSWLRSRRAAFSARARKFGLKFPKGVLLAGVPGCGKSLTCKAVASAWGMPLLQLDLGALKSKYVGESEANIRRALKTAETVSPCVLWIDEVEKALAGSTGSQGDGGVGSDALGAILTFMQECESPVFVIMTANDAASLPPELMRKGRLDEVFFVDLPNPSERLAVLETSIRQFDRDPTTMDLGELVVATDTFTGSEIANMVPDALFECFNDGERDLTTDDLLRAASTVVPLAKTAEEKIKALRQWATGRARPASISTEKAKATGVVGRAVQLDLD